MSGTTAEPLPHWNMSRVYSGLEGEDYRAARADLERQLDELEQHFDAGGIGRLGEPPAAIDAPLVARCESAIERMNQLLGLEDTLNCYVYGYFSTNSYDAAAARERSKLERLTPRLRRLQVRMQGWIGSLEALLADLTAASPLLARHAYFLKQCVRESRHLMSEELETLAAELVVDGSLAFGKLRELVTSQLKVPLERDGQSELLPVAVVHNLCNSPDRELRRRAHEAEVEAWRSCETTVAACLNAVKGTALTLSQRRGEASVLERALENNRVDRPTLEAMLGAIREAFPVFRRYLRAKAAKLGQEQLAWWDLFAPVGSAERRFDWSEARQFIADRFATFSPRLASFAERTFDEAWIDAEPRDGKVGGGFCMPLMAVEESRVLVNFDGSFDSLSTLAHELGHAFHNECQRGLEPLRRGTPSTLAETASIFCETLVAEAALADAPQSEQLAILEAQLSGATQVCLDISSRFQFEAALFERRAESELSAEELCELMLAAQRATYADAVDPATYHPYMWLWKPHYYAHEHNFYNFPYAFGHLFGLGLYAVYRRRGETFVADYEQLLRDTGGADAAELAGRFAIDLRAVDYWRESLALVAEQVTRYERL